MHRIAATPGGWNFQEEGVIFIEQTPAPIVFITAADTDIQTLAAAVGKLPEGFPELRVVNLLQLQQQLSIDTYATQVLAKAQIIIIRLLGGRSYWSYGLEVVRETVQQTKAKLIIMPGDDRPDPDLISHSNISLVGVNQLWRYFNEGGVNNFVNALKFVVDICWETNYSPPPPQEVPRVGVYLWQSEKSELAYKYLNLFPKVGILFYRAHYLAGNTAPIDALCNVLVTKNLDPVPVFVSSLRDPDVQAELEEYFHSKDGESIQVLLNTTSFSVNNFERTINNLELTANFSDVPVLQVIFSGGTEEQWESGFQGLSPRDMAMNVALPEVDGRVISRVVSFKAVQSKHPSLETDIVGYQPNLDRINFVADLAASWVKLRQKTPVERKIALILANYPTRDGKLANGVGLDTPASCVEILKALENAGYVVGNLPETGDDLINRLTAGITNDLEGKELRSPNQVLSLTEYQEYFANLPLSVQQSIIERWGIAEVKDFAIPGIQLGNIFVGIQPSRGYDSDPSLNYHAPDLEPTHDYLAFYYWVRKYFEADAIVHVGKHGNLEWLPGKSIALSSNCYPEVALGAIPHFYPFIVNDPGEGSQAKRRAQAVIIDHLTPPMTRAELYGNLHKLENLIDEYYEAQNLDPSRLGRICDRISQLILEENLHLDLGTGDWGRSAERSRRSLGTGELTSIIPQIDGYLCTLKEAQIRDGLHIFGQCPQGRQLRDLIVAIARHPGSNRIGLTRAIAKDCGLDIDPLTDDLSLVISHSSFVNGRECRTVGDVVEVLEEHAAKLVEKLIENQEKMTNNRGEITEKELTWIGDYLLPALQKTQQEITNLLQGLDGKFVPPAPSGAPTRGRPEVLPTGRNFYSVDIRAIPTETAWDIGRKAAEVLIERYTQENGEYPKTLGLSIWGTSTMRTGGDDLAEALALLGVRPIWDGVARRVVDFEILPISILGRPRVDVTLRISGFFRDAFPNLIDLFDQAVTAVAGLNESPEDNPLAAKVKQETEVWVNAGLSEEQAKMRSQFRIFGSKPGAYGAGLQGLIESQNWQDDQDLARAYINWSSYAYTSSNKNSPPYQGGSGGISAPEAFAERLRQIQIVLHNQDNREHDLLDSDDYYQFQGGLTASIRALTGKNPQTYFGDNSIPEKPKVRQLKAEIAKVYRSRVINPKWIAGVMRHGYKGAFEMSATVDYLFAYDATANCVEDFMYQGVAENYLFNSEVKEFIQQKNPWALRDMAERLLEANQRGLWGNVDRTTIDKLRAIVHEAEGKIEGN
ncbi:cobaltochelatase subunit CobN [Floridanema evergladense]|uniref:Cobaltochelatase subunit CobN n=1 Tax=Floridaenema evergladense BLCC-F167 TaxID=3153639 RepID=A0ABV4WGS9_9CYAN